MLELKPVTEDVFVPRDVKPAQATPEAVIERAVWRLWGFVRENQGSLDSGRCTSMIRQLVDGVAAELRQELAKSEAARIKSAKIVSTLRSRIKALERELAIPKGLR